jgi:hypothetical protein
MMSCFATLWVVFIPGSKYQMADVTQLSCTLVPRLSEWTSYLKPTFQNCQIPPQLVLNLCWKNLLA